MFERCRCLDEGKLRGLGGVISHVRSCFVFSIKMPRCRNLFTSSHHLQSPWIPQIRDITSGDKQRIGFSIYSSLRCPPTSDILI